MLSLFGFDATRNKRSPVSARTQKGDSRSPDSGMIRGFAGLQSAVALQTQKLSTEN
jgi:hypothetical protein